MLEAKRRGPQSLPGPGGDAWEDSWRRESPRPHYAAVVALASIKPGATPLSSLFISFNRTPSHCPIFLLALSALLPITHLQIFLLQIFLLQQWRARKVPPPERTDRPPEEAKSPRWRQQSRPGRSARCRGRASPTRRRWTRCATWWLARRMSGGPPPCG